MKQELEQLNKSLSALGESTQALTKFLKGGPGSGPRPGGGSGETENFESDVKGKETYIDGDKGVYTGKTEMIHGGKFYSVEVQEGPKKGKIKVTQRPPSGKPDPLVAQHQAEWQAQQAEFRRLPKQN